MKTARRFKASWFFLAILLAVVIGELAAWWISSLFGIRNNPLVVGFVSALVVTAIASIVSDSEDIG